MKNLITEEMVELLSRQRFIFIATVNTNGDANVAPKFLMKIDGDDIYLADYVLNRTYKNLQHNQKVALGMIDPITLNGYQFKGKAELITTGPKYKALIAELEDKTTELTVERVIKGVRTGKRQNVADAVFSDQAALFRIHVDEVIKIGVSGRLDRNKKE
jgi:uncharacterized protein